MSKGENRWDGAFNAAPSPRAVNIELKVTIRHRARAAAAPHPIRPANRLRPNVLRYINGKAIQECERCCRKILSCALVSEGWGWGQGVRKCAQTHARLGNNARPGSSPALDRYATICIYMLHIQFICTDATLVQY